MLSFVTRHSMSIVHQIGPSIIIIQNLNHIFFSCSFIECPDYNDQCPYWAASGECSKNPDYMLYSCMKSCNVDCTPGKKFGYHKTVI